MAAESGGGQGLQPDVAEFLTITLTLASCIFLNKTLMLKEKKNAERVIPISPPVAEELIQFTILKSKYRSSTKYFCSVRQSFYTDLTEKESPIIQRQKESHGEFG